jgi:hypothetical protein
MLFKQNKKEKKKITSTPNKIMPFGLSCRYSENFDDRLRTYTNAILSVDTVMPDRFFFSKAASKKNWS